MKLGMEVELGPSNIVLDGDPAPPKKGHRTNHFRPMSIVAKRLDGSRCHLVQRSISAQVIVYDGVGARRPTAAPPPFRPVSIVAKRSPISATVVLL